MAYSLKSPRPTPQFFNQTQTLSTKKARATPRDQPPPRPPVKSAPPISRIFQNKLYQNRALAVSFRNTNNSLLSPHYNERCKDLYFDQCFKIECKLGTGSFGEVFKVKSIEDGKFYAVKRSRERFRGESDRKRKLAEVQKHEQLPKHPNCIQFVKAWEERQHLYIQTELCETSLNHYSELNHDIPETLIWNYLVDLLLAVKHLHDHDLVHMDIKPANIFIAKDGTCKLGDFGLVLDLSKEDISEAQEGDPKYLAPELLEGKFGKAADIFSLGITIFELACDLDLPRGEEAWHQLRCGKIPQSVIQILSPELRNIIYLMMYPDHQIRPTVNQLLEIPAIKKVWKKRRRERSIRHVLSRLKVLFHSILMFLVMIGNFFMPHFTKLKRNTVRTPPKPVAPTVDWDQSFSDDEDFEDSSINTSQSSVGCAMLDSSSDSRNGSFAIACTSHPNRHLNSTPTLSRLRQVNISSTPANHINQTDPFSRFTPDSSRGSSLFRSLTTSVTPTGALLQTDILEEPPKLGIGPKNLLQVFEAASDED